MSEALTRYYVALDVADRPGVLAPVAESFARRGVSIKAVHQEGRGEDASLIIMTHTARESALAATIADLRRWSPCGPSTACCASKGRRASELRLEHRCLLGVAVAASGRQRCCWLVGSEEDA